MRIAFSVAEVDRNAEIGAPLARCTAFVFIDTATGEREVLENPARARERDAGLEAAHFLAARRPEAVVAGMFGSHASRVLTDAGIVLCRATSGSIDAFLTSPLARAIVARPHPIRSVE